MTHADSCVVSLKLQTAKTHVISTGTVISQTEVYTALACCNCSCRINIDVDHLTTIRILYRHTRGDDGNVHGDVRHPLPAPQRDNTPLAKGIRPYALCQRGLHQAVPCAQRQDLVVAHQGIT
eukprot:COSAG05_NODE_10085_length_583_cov_116.487603_1_plen_122_part_00